MTKILSHLACQSALLSCMLIAGLNPDSHLIMDGNVISVGTASGKTTESFQMPLGAKYAWMRWSRGEKVPKRMCEVDLLVHLPPSSIPLKVGQVVRMIGTVVDGAPVPENSLEQVPIEPTLDGADATPRRSPLFRANLVRILTK